MNHNPLPCSTRRRLAAACAGALLLGPLAPCRAAGADDALRLVQAVFDRPSGRDLTTVGRMELAERGKPPRVREIVIYRIDRGRGEATSLIRFLAPKDIAGTGLLSVAKADGSTEQSLYLPELDRVRRVAGERRGGRFVGSDFYFEDLQERKPGKDRHRTLGNEAVDGTTCVVVESVPLDAGDSVYRKRVSWIDPQVPIVVRVDYYERDDGSPSKRWESLARKRVQGYWTVTESRMTDLTTGHATRLTVEHAAYDRRLPSRLFTTQGLADEQIESEFRP